MLFLTSLISSMRACVHVCVCVVHISLFLVTVNTLIALVLRSLLYWKQSAASPEGSSGCFHSQATGSALPGPSVYPGRGEAGFGGCLLLMVTEVFGAPKSGGCWLGSPVLCCRFLPCLSLGGPPSPAPSWLLPYAGVCHTLKVPGKTLAGGQRARVSLPAPSF